MTTALRTVNQPGELDPSTVQSVLLSGDISRLSPTEKTAYYNRVCESLGLNPLTQPFEFLTLNGKMRFYALKSCTEQLRQIHGVSLSIVQREVVEGCYVVTARATTKTGRQDESIGAVPIEGLKGEARANALMKAETKAKRRVTLSVCGLGMLDESEVDSIPQATTKGQRQDRVIEAKPVCYRCEWAASDCSCKEGPMTKKPAGPDATLEQDLKASVDAGMVEVIDATTGEVTKKPKVTKAQLGKIHVLKAQGGYGDEQWKRELKAAYGTESSANLTKDQATHWIEKLQRKIEAAGTALAAVGQVIADAEVEGPEGAGVTGAIDDALSEPVQDATADQKAEMGDEIKRLGWTAKQASEWLKSRTGCATRDELTYYQAKNALSALLMLADGTQPW